MTVKEYLGQAYLLTKRIESETLECDELRALSQTITSPGFEEHFNATKNTEAPYIRTLEKLIEMEEKIMDEVSVLLELKKQIRETISRIEVPEYQMLLRYRYIHNYSWAVIADLLMVDSRTVQRWHNKAISKVVIPKNAINLKDVMVCHQMS